MGWLDSPTMSAITAMVVVVCGALYLIDTLTYAGSAATRLWAVAFTSGTLTAFAYLIWAYLPGAWVAVAAGNASFTATIAFLWLGCRRFNGGARRWALVLAVAAITATFLAAALPGPDGGAWAGAEVMFVSMALFGALACLETRRGPLAQHAPSVSLTIIMATVALYYAVRTVVLLVSGTESALFVEWFGTPSTSIITIVLTITALAAMVVLRLQDDGGRHRRESAPLTIREDGYLDSASFLTVLTAVLRRGEGRAVTTPVIAVEIDGMAEISSALGAHRARQLSEGMLTAVTAVAPVAALLGIDDEGGVLIALPDASPSQALRLAGRISELTLDELDGATPLLGVGVAVDEHGHGARWLIERALRAATTSADNLDSAPVLAAVD